MGKTKVASKVLIFGWTLILNKMFIRMESLKQGIIESVDNIVCSLCFLNEEDVIHLFCSCSYSNLIWFNFCVWIGVGATSFAGSLLDRDSKSYIPLILVGFLALPFVGLFGFVGIIFSLGTWMSWEWLNF